MFKTYLVLQGIQKVPSGPRYPKGTCHIVLPPWRLWRRCRQYSSLDIGTWHLPVQARKRSQHRTQADTENSRTILSTRLADIEVVRRLVWYGKAVTNLFWIVDWTQKVRSLDQSEQSTQIGGEKYWKPFLRS